MKNIKIFALLFTMILTGLPIDSCNKDTGCTKAGEIINYNGNECMCCPGWIIQIGNDTIKALNLPISIENQVRDITIKSGFPISVTLNFKNTMGSCKDFYKEITCMEIEN